MPRKAQRYGGLSPRQVRLIKDYLRTHAASAVVTNHDAFSTWVYLVERGEEWARGRAALAGISTSTVDALAAGLAAMKRKRVGRIWRLNPRQSFRGNWDYSGRKEA